MFKRNFEKICFEKRISPSSVMEAVGLNRSTYSCWTDDSVPRRKTLEKLADYLHVTVDDLLRDDTEKTAEPETPPNTENPLIDQIRQAAENLTDQQIEQVIEYIDFLILSKRNKK